MVAREDSGGAENPADDQFRLRAPQISLPKGGGAIRGMGEKFTANPVTGTGSMSVPLALSPGRAGFGPQLSLSYDSGAGNGPFGLGWNLSTPSVTRKTDKGLPKYEDATEPDVFILSGAEDLVPVVGDPVDPRTIDGATYRIERYRPRVEGLFARIERWTDTLSGQSCWRSISRDNVTTWYGRTPESRIHDPADMSRIFSWLICESYDDKGNALVFEYVAENDHRVDLGAANERHRARTAHRYLRKIKYGNTPSRLDPDFAATVRWHFEVQFDYGDNICSADGPDADANVYAFVKKQAPAAIDWPVRSDPQSSYRAGFEVRAYRLCHRVLMFHRFDELLADDEPQLVRSTEIGYEDDPVATRAVSITHCSYAPATEDPARTTERRYLRRTLPPLEFTYSEARIDGEAHAADAASVENLPRGLDGANYQWIDLDGEGLPGILSDQGDGWFYKRNLAPVNLETDPDGVQRARAKFAPLELIGTKPNAPLAGGAAQFADLAGDGQIDLVLYDGPTPGFYEHDGGTGWESFRAFVSRLNRDIRDPNLRFVDLDGDGHADVLITEDEVLTWHPSRGEAGFGPAQRVHKARDEEAGPALVFADAEQSVYLADMSGDGLSDIVRIRNGAVCYWPNLGYGLFGAKVTMDRSPWFDAPDQFSHARLHLADIDGTGATDIVYLHRDGVRLYFNESGNAWSDARPLPGFPRVDSESSTAVVDLLGNGTACLVWSSPLPADARAPLKYIDLMGGCKPHLLTGVSNNLGATTTIEYAPSTQFYLQDKMAGKPWITRLPFPVHCVAKSTVFDKWRNSTFSSTYSYHHGFFDGIEREFRGFGRVEQVDVESFDTFLSGNVASPYITSDHTLYQPPIKTVTWFHTGASLDRKRILSQFAGEYFSGTFAENPLPEPDLEALRLSADEWREALRACKGKMLRQEVFELDVDALHLRGEQVPVKLFSAAQHSCHVRLLQARGDNPYAVFLVAESEAITYHYELDLLRAPLAPDPRIAHTLNLDFDDFGRPVQTVAISYPRSTQFGDATLDPAGVTLIRAVQGELHIGYTETRYTDDDVDDDDNHRPPLPCEVQTFELTGLVPPGGLRNAPYYSIDELRAYRLSDRYQAAGTAVQPLEYHEHADLTPPPKPQKRLVEHARALYFDDASDSVAPTVALAFGKHGPRGLKFEDYKLALTDTLLDAVFQRRDAAGALIEDKLALAIEPGVSARDLLADATRSGYVAGTQIEASLAGQYWMRSGTARFENDAALRFYLPERYIDPFGNETTLEFDNYDLYVASSSDELGNTVTVEQFDLRVMAPVAMKDANDNVTAVAFDVRGLPASMAVMGKLSTAPPSNESKDTVTGATLEQLNPRLADTLAFFRGNAFDGRGARLALSKATTRFLYHLGEKLGAGGIEWEATPSASCSIARERHERDFPNVDTADESLQLPIQVSLEYTDGLGSVLMKKIQAEPVPGGNELRWIASGKTVLNNKGKPVKQYEPYFSVTKHRFDGAEATLEVGVTTLLYYDSAGRLVRTELPDGTYRRVEFSPWYSLTFDANDTAYDVDATKRSDWYNRRTVPTHPRFAEFNNAQDRRAATLVEMHANTPTATYLDSLGRDVVHVAHNKYQDRLGALHDEKYLTFTRLDAEGKPLWTRDARGNLVMQYITPPKANDDASNAFAATETACYDIAGNLLYQHSMDAGDRWMLMDAAGKPMLAWDFNKSQDENGLDRDVESRIHYTEYDELHRPTNHWLVVNGQRNLVEATEYAETLADGKQRNLRGLPYRQYDPSGLNEVERHDFNGKQLDVKRTLTNQYEAALLDWSIADRDSLLEDETFAQETEYDALGRVTRRYSWHRDVADARVAVYVPAYNPRGLLGSETLDVGASKTAAGHTPSGNPLTDAISEIRYDVKGQKERLELGNGTVTRYTYDKETYRMRVLYTRRDARFTEDCGGAPPPPRTAAPDTDTPPPSCGLQNLQYTYDAVGNITHIEDQAQETVWFANRQVDAGGDYTYDARYRLISASGRENSAAPNPPPHPEAVWPVSNRPSPDSVNRYTQQYTYDSVGNFIRVDHKAFRGAGQGNGDWIRQYQTADDSNRLLRTWFGAASWDNTPADKRTEYRYDAHGNMLNLANTAPGLDIRWDWRDMIRTLDLLGGGDVFYNYGADKQRTRKRLVKDSGAIEDRIYLSGYELYRRYDATDDTDAVEEIATLHLFEGEQRVLLVDDVVATDRTHANGTAFATAPIHRYQYGNHLGSASLELDEQAEIISYEEYHPYGTSAYRAMKRDIEAPPKRYRFAGMERDEESGLSYHSARYYLSWIGRWSGCDPKGAPNRYEMCASNPINATDRSGLDPRCAGDAACVFDPDDPADAQQLQERLGPLAEQPESWHQEIADMYKDQIAEDNYRVKASRLHRSWNWIKNSYVGQKIGGATSAIGEAIDDLEKAFDRAAAEPFYNATGAEHRPPELQSINQDTFKKAQEIPGPSIRAGADAMFQAATLPGDVKAGAAVVTGIAKLGTAVVTNTVKIPFWFSEFAKFSRREATFRAQVARVIASWRGNHPLDFLITSEERLRKSLGKRTIDYLKDHPEIVEAGHVKSKLTGDGNPLVIMTAYVNQSLKRDVEGRGLGAYIDLEYALDIGGVLVEQKSANAWVAKGLLDQSIVDNAARVYFK